MKAILALTAALLLGSPLGAVQVRTVDPDLYADPIPARITRALLESHGFTDAQAALFRVVRRIPIELGGTNEPANLLILGRADAEAHEQRVQTVLRWVRENRMTISAAVKSLSEEKD